MIDKSTKIILASIASGLWANARVPVLKSGPEAIRRLVEIGLNAKREKP
jgi:hypothetical protein